MTIRELEPVLTKKGYELLEVRLLRNGGIHWFLCKREDHLVVVDKNGDEWESREKFPFPEDSSDIKIYKTQFGLYANGVQLFVTCHYSVGAKL